MEKHISRCNEYHYQFYDNLFGNVVFNKDAQSGYPQWNSNYNDDRRMLGNDSRKLNDLGNPPKWTKLGVFFVEQSALRTPLSGQSLVTTPPYTIIMWVYVLKVNQESCLFGKVNVNSYDINNIGYYLNNGKLMIRTSKRYD